MSMLTPMILHGKKIQLEPLSELHQAELYHAAQDEKIWQYNSSKAFGEQFYSWFDKAMQGLRDKTQLPFIVRHLADNKILGSTRYYDIHLEHRRLTIGYTWYIPAVWGTYVNIESKFLLLTFAFEDLQMNRVEFFADSRNLRSCAAIKKIGATQEGLLRQHMILEDGFVRDSMVFSLIKSDWSNTKEGLLKKLEDIY